MRRLASVFAPRREKNDSLGIPPSASSLSLASTKKGNVRRADSVNSPAVSTHSSSPHFGRGSDIGQSSSSSSGSASLQTPDDILISLEQQPKSKSWINSWLSKKPSVTKVKHAQQTNEQDREWVASVPPPLLRLPPPGIRTAPPVQDSDPDTDTDDEDDTSSLSVHRRSIPSSAVPISRKYLSAHLQNALAVRPPSASPFILRSHSRTPIYPRSCNRTPLSRQDTLLSLMLKKHLLKRLVDPTDSLTPAEQFSILPFSMRTPPSLLPAFASSVDETALPKNAQVFHHSPGLRHWIDRPCFEHRFSVWLPVGDDIKSQTVTGTRFAVPDLEFSEAIESMVDFSSPSQSQVQICETAEVDASSQTLLAPSHSRVSMQPSSPSPLRNEADPLKKAQPGPSPSVLPPSLSQTTKRGVRFAEDDKEDQIPIGYILRVKKQREAKAKFLREEKERRQFSVEQARAEEEKRKREEQRLEWEKERKAWDKEKRAMEEERNKHLYTEELAAARARREISKAGGNSKTIPTSSSVTSLRSTGSNERHREQSTRYVRPVYDTTAPAPRRQASEPAPAGSRPPSFTGHSPPSGSRPSSVYSSSSEDIRTKRHSTASSSNVHGRWSGSNTSLIPPSPSFIPSSFLSPMPPSSFDMPLLPPTAPFMMHQHRPRSQASGSPSPSRSSMNPSTDRVHRASGYESSSNRSSSSSPQRSIGHQRQSSADGHPIRPSPRGRSSEPASSAARPQASSLSSRPNINKTQMPYSFSGTLPSRRSTALS